MGQGARVRRPINVIAKEHGEQTRSQVEGDDRVRSDPAGQLRELANLKNEGILSDEEFAAAKAKLLSSM
jgi:hypothetical protein